MATQGRFPKKPVSIGSRETPPEPLAYRMHDSHGISKALILFAKGFDGNLSLTRRSENLSCRNRPPDRFHI